MCLTMKRWIGCLLVLGALTAQAQLLPPEQRPISVDGFAAVVNERIITAGEVLTFIEPKRQQVIQTIRDKRKAQEELQKLYDEGLRVLIDRQLILLAFDDSELQLPENLVNDRMSEIINRRFANDRAAFEQTLAEEGVTLKEWRDQIRENLKMQIMRRVQIQDRIAVVPRQIRELYEQRVKALKSEEEVRLRAIAMKRPESREERTAVLRELYDIQLKIRDGEDFATLAREHSQDSHAEDGGDFGWMKLSYLKGELVEAIKSLDEGKVSDVVRAGDYYYLLRVEGRKDGKPRSLLEMQPELEAELMAVEEKRLYTDWMARLRNKYHVSRF